jgi:hypothetical protein
VGNKADGSPEARGKLAHRVGVLDGDGRLEELPQSDEEACYLIY